MPVEVTCPKCGARLAVRDELAGRRVKCPKCRQGVLEIPLSVSDSEVQIIADEGAAPLVPSDDSAQPGVDAGAAEFELEAGGQQPSRRPSPVEMDMAADVVPPPASAGMGIAAHSAELVSHAESGRGEAEQIGVDDGLRPGLCPRCKRPVEMGKTTCSNCGADLRTGEVPQQVKHKVPWIPLIAGGVLLVGAVITLIVLWPKEEPEPPPPPRPIAQKPALPADAGKLMKAIEQVTGKKMPTKPGQKPTEKAVAAAVRAVSSVGGGPLGTLPDATADEEACYELIASYRERYLAEAVRNEPAGWVELGDWCGENGLKREARWAYLRAVELDPTNEKAQAAFGRTRKMGRTYLTKAQAKFLQGLAPRVSVWNTDSSLGTLELKLGTVEAKLAVGQRLLLKTNSEPQTLQLTRPGRRPVSVSISIRPLPAQELEIEVLGPVTASVMDMSGLKDVKQLWGAWSYRDKMKSKWRRLPGKAGESWEYRSSGAQDALVATFSLNPKGKIQKIAWNEWSLTAAGADLPRIDTIKNTIVGRLKAGEAFVLVGTKERPICLRKGNRLMSGTMEKGDTTIHFLSPDQEAASFMNFALRYRISSEVERIVDAEVWKTFGQEPEAGASETATRSRRSMPQEEPAEEENRSRLGAFVSYATRHYGTGGTRRQSSPKRGSGRMKAAEEHYVDRQWAKLQARALNMEAFGVLTGGEGTVGWVGIQLEDLNERNQRASALLDYQDVAFPYMNKRFWMPIVSGDRAAELIEAYKSQQEKKEAEAAPGADRKKPTSRKRSEDGERRPSLAGLDIGALLETAKRSHAQGRAADRKKTADAIDEFEEALTVVPARGAEPGGLLETPAYVHLTWRRYSQAIRDMTAAAGNESARIVLEKLTIEEEEGTKSAPSKTEAQGADGGQLSPEMQRQLVLALICADQGAASDLRGIARNVEDLELRAEIVACLERIAPDQAVAVAKELLPVALGNPRVCSRMMRTLGRIATPEAMALLKSKADSLDTTARIASLAVLLATQGPEEGEAYVETVAAMDVEMQLQVVDEVAAYGGQGAVIGLEQLAVALPDPDVRERITLRLTQTGGYLASYALGKLTEVSLALYGDALSYIDPEEYLPVQRSLANLVMLNGLDASEAALWLGILGGQKSLYYLKAAAEEGSQAAICGMLLQGRTEALEAAHKYVDRIGPGVIALAGLFWQDPQALVPLPASEPWEWKPQLSASDREAIVAVLNDATETTRHPWVQLEASELLVRMGFVPSEEVLVNMAKVGNPANPVGPLCTRRRPVYPYAGRLLAISLDSYVKKQVPEVFNITKSIATREGPVEIRTWAIQELGESKEPEIADVLCEMLTGVAEEYETVDAIMDEAEVRAAAAAALGGVRESKSFQALLNTLKQPIGRKMKFAGKEITEKESVKNLANAEAMVRAAVCQALGQLGEPKAIDVLDEIASGHASENTVPSGTPGDMMREAAILALADFPNAQAVQCISRVNKEGFGKASAEFWSQVCLKMASKLTAENAAVLGEMLRDLNPGYAEVTLYGVIQVTPPKARVHYPALVAALTGESKASPMVNRIAIGLLGLSGGGRGVADIMITDATAPQMALVMLEHGAKNQAVALLADQLKKSKGGGEAMPQNLEVPKEDVPIFMDFLAMYSTVVRSGKVYNIPVSSWRVKNTEASFPGIAKTQPPPAASASTRLAICVLRRANTTRARDLLRQMVRTDKTEAAIFAARALGSLGDENFLRTQGVEEGKGGSKTTSSQGALTKLACIHGMAMLPDPRRAAALLVAEALTVDNLNDVCVLDGIRDAFWLLQNRPRKMPKVGTIEMTEIILEQLGVKR